MAAEFTTLQEAYIAKGMLEDNGIPVVIENATISSVYPMTLSWAPIKIMVPEAQLPQAESLLHRAQ